MSSPFVAEIRMFACNFAPTGWAQCNGQLLPIYQNTALFSLLGTFYGGDGKVTFALPDLQGAAPMSWGQGPGLPDRFLGEQGGSEFVTLLQSEMPFHNHLAKATSDLGDTADAGWAQWAETGGRAAQRMYSTAVGTPAAMGANALQQAGSSLPHNNMQPYLVVNFCIAMQGVFPPRG